MATFVPVFSARHSARFENLRRSSETDLPRMARRNSVVAVDPQQAPAIPNGVRRSAQQPQAVVGVEERASAKTSQTMVSKTHGWISVWFALTIPVIFWDAMYCFMRPRSMIGGDLHWIWEPYGLYQSIDYVYGLRALDNKEGFTNAQSLLNIVENFMNIAYLYLAHISLSSAAPLLGFASAVMTLSKTVLYLAQEYFCGGCSVGHNSLKTILVYWILPNGLWILVPSMIVYQLGKDLVGSLRRADAASKKFINGKTE